MASDTKYLVGAIRQIGPKCLMSIARPHLPSGEAGGPVKTNALTLLERPFFFPLPITSNYFGLKYPSG
jgi:hypothetical protein